MAKTYKTPGVYVEEISLLPPSIAEVETAIPAFIGYTEKAEKDGDPIYFKPTVVKSMAEYRSYFGGAPQVAPTVTLSETNVVTKVDNGDNKFYLFDSLQLFYNNGGGKCYIISVGKYEDGKIELGDDTKGLKAGLRQLKKEDEPTLILAPDAVLMEGDTDLYDFQKAALDQSNELQDRFVICDLKNTSTDSSSKLEEDAQDFRDNIGINNLKYGAAYMPWLNVNLTKNVLYKNLTLKREKSEETLKLENLTKDKDIQDFIVKNLQAAVNINKSIKTDIIDHMTGGTLTLKEKFNAIIADYEEEKTYTDADDFHSEIRAIYNYLSDILYQLLVVVRQKITDTTSFKLKADLDKLVKDNEINETLKVLIQHSNATIGFSGSTKIFQASGAFATRLAALITQINTITGYVDGDDGFIKTGDTDTDINAEYAAESDIDKKGDIARDAASSAFSFINALVIEFKLHAETYELKFDESLSDIFALYKSIIKKVNEKMNVLPPSGAVAGVYARVDSNRGVWKAPANVSLNLVIGPSEMIDSKTQEGLNVDVNAGKSINAIRAFAGKGTLIWGARTLAGNDNEWRYVPVRRFYNFAEESVKKGSSWVVFEPNDANTWVKVKAMIENFLIKQWRNGALAGSKPEDAFFVKVGLGETMTSLDILEGRMNIEIGMAVVRPAEFIILKFSHKLQES